MSSHIFFLLLLRLPPVSTLTSPRFPYTTPFRSAGFLRPLSSVQEDDTSAVLITFLVSAPEDLSSFLPAPLADAGLCSVPDNAGRSEEHTSELQSLMRISYAVFFFKKKINNFNYRSIVYCHEDKLCLVYIVA